ncbi:MAG: hypothetical protein U0X92_09405 [Anaerolineales bacterium]
MVRRTTICAKTCSIEYIENMGEPKENYSRRYNASLYFFLDRINAPVQLICGGTTHAVPRPI